MSFKRTTRLTTNEDFEISCDSTVCNLKNIQQLLYCADRGFAPAWQKTQQEKWSFTVCRMLTCTGDQGSKTKVREMVQSSPI